MPIEKSTEKAKYYENESCSDEEDEELDPRIKMELEKLNAATDGINHLETEFGEAQALFQQMMQDATFQLKDTHQKLGKSVDKSRPYYGALKSAKFGHSLLHDAALKFEQAQSQHYNAKKRVTEAEKKAFCSNDRHLDPALQELLNQATIEVMDAASLSQTAWEIHRAASVEFGEKQKNVQDLYESLRKHINKSRSYFELKMNLNKQLEIQKKRLEKIQEGIQGSKNAYSDTLRSLEMISDDIRRARELKQKAFLEPRGQGVGADSDREMTHCAAMERIRAVSLDNISDSISNFDAESSDSDQSTTDIHLLTVDTDFDRKSPILSDNSPAQKHKPETDMSVNVSTKMHIDISNETSANSYDSSSVDSNQNNPRSKNRLSIIVTINEDLKEISNQVDDSYEVITSHSIPCSPPPFDVLPDTIDGKKQLEELDKLNSRRKARSFTDLTDYNYFIGDDDQSLQRSNSDPSVRKHTNVDSEVIIKKALIIAASINFNENHFD